MVSSSSSDCDDLAGLDLTTATSFLSVIASSAGGCIGIGIGVATSCC